MVRFCGNAFASDIIDYLSPEALRLFSNNYNRSILRSRIKNKFNTAVFLPATNNPRTLCMIILNFTGDNNVLLIAGQPADASVPLNCNLDASSTVARSIV